LVERKNNIKQLITDYKNGNADIEKLKKFSKQIEYVAHKETSMLPAQIQIFRAYISGKISEQLGSKWEAHILTPVIKDISHIITQYLDSRSLSSLAIATSLGSAKYLERMEKEQEGKAAQER